MIQSIQDQRTDTFEIVTERAGWYTCRMVYSTTMKTRLLLMVNGAYQGGVVLTPGEHAVCESPAVLLGAGKQQVMLEEDWGAASLEGMRFWPVDAPVLRPCFRLSNPEASPECRRVMALLERICGERVLVGQHVNGGNADLELLESLGGDLPALMGFDMMAFSTGCFPEKRTLACVEEVTSCLGNVERALYWGRDRGALITLCWHWFSPTDGWDKSFYTQNTRFDLAEALKTKDERYTLLLRDIDLVSEQLIRLRDAGVPVLWRPLHEAEGKWFWWGASGAEACIALYRLMYDRMTRMHGLNNLIWVWNSVAPDWYPGDDVVDIISTDIYAPHANDGELSMEYARCMGASKDALLPAALGEVGVAPDMERVCGQGLPWLWYMLWSGFTRREDQNPRERLRQTLIHPAAVLLGEYRRLLDETTN